MDIDKIFNYVKRTHPGLPAFVHEEWRPVVNAEIEPGAYSVSSWGEIKDNATQTIIPSAETKGGYRIISLRNKKGYKDTFRVHRVVGEAFIEHPSPQKDIINHIDGNTSNNVYTNLEWVTSKENTEHAWEIGLQEINVPYITTDEVHVVCKMFEECKTYAEIEEYLISRHPDLCDDLDKLRGFLSNIKSHRSYVSISSQYNIDNKYHRAKYSTSEIEKMCQMLSNPESTVQDFMTEFNVDDSGRKALQQFLSDIIRGVKFKDFSDKYTLYYPQGMINRKGHGVNSHKSEVIELLKQGKSYDDIVAAIFTPEELATKSQYDIVLIKKGISHIKRHMET